VALRRRVTVREDPDLSAQVPRLKPARVTVTFTDGRQVTRLRESARGDYQDPYGEDEVRSKFRELASLVLGPAGVTRVEALVDRLDELPRLGELVEALHDDRGPEPHRGAIPRAGSGPNAGGGTRRREAAS
jgi:2-methylcitrate dehydratase PrpD